MNLKRLKTFILVIEQQSFSAVADILAVSQPAVSKQIKALEEELQVTLLDRDNFSMTKAGQLVFTQGKTLLQCWENLVQQCRAFQGQLTGLLKIGASTIPGTYLVPNLIKNFTSIYPQIEIRLFVHESAQIVELILQGKIDVGLVGSKPEMEELESRFIAQDHLVLIGPPKSAEIVDPEELKSLPFIFRSSRSGTWQAAEQGILKWSRLSLQDLNCVAKVDSTESVLSLVQAGLGYSIVSSIAGQAAVEQNRIKILAKLPVERRFLLTNLKARENDPLLAEFIRLAQK